MSVSKTVPCTSVSLIGTARSFLLSRTFPIQCSKISTLSFERQEFGGWGEVINCISSAELPIEFHLAYQTACMCRAPAAPCRTLQLSPWCQGWFWWQQEAPRALSPGMPMLGAAALSPLLAALDGGVLALAWSNAFKRPWNVAFWAGILITSLSELLWLKFPKDVDCYRLAVAVSEVWWVFWKQSKHFQMGSKCPVLSECSLVNLTMIWCKPANI